MRLAEAFARQRAAFEAAYATDNWDGLGPFFHDDVVYEVMNVPYHCVVKGRNNMVAAFRRSVEKFDRKCTRILGQSPKFYEEGDNFLVHGSIEYRRRTDPMIQLGLWEIATYREGRITRLTDLYDPGSRERVEQWMAKWGAGLDPAYV